MPLRIVPGFLVQTGDRTGTGAGGESFYGGTSMRSSRHSDHSRDVTEPFEDEIHPRLRFAHRGLVAMANNGTKNSNDSQFFITLGPPHCFIALPRLTRPQIARTSFTASTRCSAVSSATRSTVRSRIPVHPYWSLTSMVDVLKIGEMGTLALPPSWVVIRFSGSLC